MRAKLLLFWFLIQTVRVALVTQKKGWDGVAKAAAWTRLRARGSARIAGHKFTGYGNPEAVEVCLIVGNHQ